ncbi:hypothetical protein EW146_g6315 [Bondarzewia mesenterica]|uniref:Uncharacterized protein n=1 Tax=Bondarzewia mesenterica TaxID=1095465 RepID=A0A4S4LNW8_9AGAM|nr:hypothetical protein EW146_g6315 [Bondarzewia mesenterica]
MFKRVEKRRRRKEKEEELGIDEEMKEVMGLQDTDSSESESSSDSDSDRSEDEVEVEDQARKVRREKKRLDESDAGDEGSEEGPASEVDSDAGEEESDGSGMDEGDEEEVADDDDRPHMTVAAALEDPLYVVSMDPEIQACILCPGKQLKNPIMIGVHITSKLHTRSLKRFARLAHDADPEDDAIELLAPESYKSSAAPSELSKRQLKRKEKQAKIIAHREKQKKLKAKSIARKELQKAAKRATEENGEAPSSPPPQKPSEVSDTTASKSKSKPKNPSKAPPPDVSMGEPKRKKQKIGKPLPEAESNSGTGELPSSGRKLHHRGAQSAAAVGPSADVQTQKKRAKKERRKE